MEFSVVEFGPHYGNAWYYMCEGPNNEQQQFVIYEEEVSLVEYAWGSLQTAIEHRVRSAVLDSGQTTFLTARAAIEGQVYNVMQEASQVGMAQRRVDPKVVTLADHQARLKKEQQGKPAAHAP